ncbi:MAG: hypothetical protein K8R67_13370 [Desulfobacteraceae bacterium]|nr:hypothetical protein [Desulfobacteraceae bacterium]
MEFNTVLDISSIIWNKEDYNSNTNEYYKLIYSVSMLLEKLKESKSKILLRDELLGEMINGFPFDRLPNKFHAFGEIVYLFLGKIGSEFITYSDSTVTDIVSIPNQIKEYYNDKTKNEVRYLILKIHSDDFKSVYFTFEYLWEGTDNLTTQIGEESKEYKTIISDKENDLNDFFGQIKPTFEHNPKHDRIKSGTYEASLSCFDGTDTEVPQMLLNNSINSNGIYYNFDSLNDVWVVFRCHLDNKYHGYDENDPNKIPKIVRGKLHR